MDRLAQLAPVDLLQAADLLVLHGDRRGDGDHDLVHMLGEAVHQPNDSVWEAPSAQVDGGVQGHLLGDRMHMLPVKERPEQVGPGFGITVHVREPEEYQRHPEQGRMDLSQLAGHLVGDAQSIGVIGGGIH